MTQLERQPRSGLATVKRDFSSKQTMEPSSPSAPTATATKRSTLSASLRKAIQDGVASREAEKASLTSTSSDISSQKRSLPFDVAPPAKKRQLPTSWGDLESRTAISPQTSSQSSVHPSSRFFMTNAPPTDTSSDDRPSELKLAKRPVKVTLSQEQKQIMELVMQQKNIFYTGSAGVLSLSLAPRLMPILCQLCDQRLSPPT
jgi:hypothetical protein